MRATRCLPNREQHPVERLGIHPQTASNDAVASVLRFLGRRTRGGFLWGPFANA